MKILKKEPICVEVYSDIYLHDTLNNLRELFTQIEEDNKECKDFTIREGMRCWDESVNVYATRLETDAELSKRQRRSDGATKAAKTRKEKKEAKDARDYARLQKKFGDSK